MWRAARRIFEQILEAPAIDRQQLLEEHCTGRPELLAAVARLLDADGLTRVWFDATPTAAALVEALEDELAQHWIGRSLGAYKLVEKIGQGGMGIVFLAEREDQAFDKKVAIKIMSATSGTALARFHRERQILADLEHPGIARLIDGGTTADGLPYVAMEHVDGLPLDAYCTTGSVDLDARLQLFLEICDAVQFAHRNLVVHRDLKPSNILVTAEGQPKLLDFGIAKLLDTPAGDAQTLAADHALTPDYASPEQLAGASVTTASDVYSLGVVLYEMLTSTRPFRRGTAAPECVAREPEAPSIAATRAHSAATPATGDTSAIAARWLRGDLDTIVRKALRRAPADRYASVERLAADIEFFRVGLPISARAPSLGYRTGKFVRRHAWALVLAAAALVLLIGFSIVTFLQSQRIQAERDVARQALGVLVETFRGADPQQNLGQQVTAQDILERGAERLGSDSPLPDEVKGILMRTLGQVQISLGENELGRDWLRRAVAAGERLYGRADPRLAPDLVELADALLFTVEYQEAEATARRALSLMIGDQPALEIRAMHAEAEARAGLGRWNESAARHEEALVLARQALRPEDPQLLESLRMTALRTRSIRQTTRARVLVDEGLELQRRYRPGDRGETARLLLTSGRLHMDARDLERARVELEGSLAMKLRIYGEAHPTVASGYDYLARLEQRAGHVALAVELTEKSLRIYEASLGGEHPQAVGVRLNYAELVHQELGDPERAEPIYRRALTDFAATEGSERNPGMGFILSAYGQVLNDLGRFAEAAPIWRQARNVWMRREQGDNTASLAAQLGLAAAAEGLGDNATAAHELEQCWRVASEGDDLDHPFIYQVGDALADFYRRTNRVAEATAIETKLAAVREGES